MEPQTKSSPQTEARSQERTPSPILGMDSSLPGRELENVSAHSKIRQVDGQMDSANALTVNLVIAKCHDARIREIERTIAGAWSEMAEIAVQVRDNEEYLLLGFHSFGAWLSDAVPRSRSTVYAAIGLLEELKDVPMEDLRQIGIGNAGILKSLSTGARRRQDVLEAAKVHQPRDFASLVSETVPESHLEPYVNPRFRFTVSQWKVIQEAIEQVIEQYDGEIKSREEALEALCAEWRQEQ